jgi:hypothetical protein
LPRFTVRVSSGQSRPCRFNVGAKSVAVVVSSGHRRVWSSSDCGAGSNVAVIDRDEPVVVRFSWDRRTSSPGCRGTSHLVRAGEYQVIAEAGQLISKTANIVLGAQGASGP